MSAQPSPRSRPNPHATPRPGAPNRGDGARARLTVAPETARRRLRARLLMWGAALVTVASLFTLVSFHVFAAQSAFTLERLSKERTNEQLRNARLRQQVAASSSAATVIAESNHLGMVDGSSVVNLTVPASLIKKSGPPSSPGASTVGSSSNAYSQTKKALGPTP